MSYRALLTAVAEENQKYAYEQRIPRTCLYKHEYMQKKRPKLVKPLSMDKVEFVNMTTEKGGYYAKSLGFENVVLMNFANRHHAGGGYTKGASAQEEDLCRCFPLLYPSLKKTKKFPYRLTDVMVSDRLRCMRDSKNNYKLLPKDKQESFYFVSAAAPNLRYGRDKFVPEVEALAFDNVILAPIIQLKLSDPSKNCLVVGAWGCGAFGNDPVKMATLMKKELGKYGGHYGKVIFAVPIFKDKTNFVTFKTIIKNIKPVKKKPIEVESVSDSD